MRCSDNIFKQLSQNYLKFRNTARYCLGNLDGFDPNNLVKPEEMVELDRWAVTKLNGLIEKCFAAYDNFEFHVVSHAINDFCVVELSSFYLDIIKDRLYCEEKDGLLRRSAQTALWMILDTMTKLFAPILAFTCDEIWLAMPHRDGDDGRNVLLNEMNKPFAEYALEEDAMSAWSGLIDVRNAVNVALEQARNEKKIGKSLEAKVTIPSNRIAGSQLIGMDELADLLIVSQVEVSSDVTDIQVEPAAGAKCERCWKVLPTVGADSKHPTLCPRCAQVVPAFPCSAASNRDPLRWARGWGPPSAAFLGPRDQSRIKQTPPGAVFAPGGILSPLSTNSQLSANFRHNIHFHSSIIVPKRPFARLFVFFLRQIIFHNNADHAGYAPALFMRLNLQPFFKIVGHAKTDLCLSLIHTNAPFGYHCIPKIVRFLDILLVFLVLCECQ